MKPPRAIAAIQASVATAADEQVAQIVALVDSLNHRGAADGLLAPLRPRLARLRPPRRASFTRLLFTPLDPLVVAGPGWRRDMLAVPRSALMPIADALRAATLPESEQVEVEGRQGLLSHQRIMELAVAIWPRAAALLASNPAPPHWTEATGLPASDFAPLANRIAAVLNVAADIQLLALRRQAPPEDAIRTILGRTASRGVNELAAVVAVLLAVAAGSGRIIALATEAAGSDPALAVDRAVEHTLDTLQNAADMETLIGTSIIQATEDAARLTGTLFEIEISAATRPERKHRIDRLRQDAHHLCLARFEAALHQELLAKVAALHACPDDKTVESFEHTARSLRRLASNGGTLGGGERYDAALRDSVWPFQQEASHLSFADRARLIEILVGAEKTLALIKMPPV